MTLKLKSQAGYLIPCSPVINDFVPLFPKITILISYVAGSSKLPLVPRSLILDICSPEINVIIPQNPCEGLIKDDNAIKEIARSPVRKKSLENVCIALPDILNMVSTEVKFFDICFCYHSLPLCKQFMKGLSFYNGKSFTTKIIYSPSNVFLLKFLNDFYKFLHFEELFLLTASETYTSKIRHLNAKDGAMLFAMFRCSKDLVCGFGLFVLKSNCVDVIYISYGESTFFFTSFCVRTF